MPVLNPNPIFTLPAVGAVNMSVANTDATGATGTTYTLATGNSLGSRVDRVDFKASATTLAGLIRLFLKNGSNFYPLKPETVVPVVTASTTVAAWEGSVVRTDGQPICVLPSASWSLVATLSVVNAITGVALTGDY